MSCGRSHHVFGKKSDLKEERLVQPPEPGLQAQLEQIVDESLIPVAGLVGVLLLVAVLSQQMLRVATAWRTRKTSKAERMRKVLLRRGRTMQDRAGMVFKTLQQGKLSAARNRFSDLMSFCSRLAAEPTWEETVRAELAAFREQWSTETFGLKFVMPGSNDKKGRGSQDGFVARLFADPLGLLDKWSVSAQSVAKGYIDGALAEWATGGDRAPTGLVIRIYGRWPEEAAAAGREQGWVNIANLPLAGDWREKALRLLIPAEKDVQDLPIIGPACELVLTSVVSKQVTRVVNESAWGSLTKGLWHRGSEEKEFQIGYEVVEVATRDREEMISTARKLPVSGTPGRVVQVAPVEA